MSQPDAPEPCPTCKGFCCCRVENGLPIPHSVATLYIRHVCPDCDDGTYEICSEPEPFVPSRTADDERADVVAWLRDVGTSASMSADEMVTLHWVARAIFGKEHVGYAKKEKP